MHPKKIKLNPQKVKSKSSHYKSKRYLLYSADTLEVRPDFPTIFEDLVSNYNSRQFEVTIKEEEEEPNSLHQAVTPVSSSSHDTGDKVEYSEGVSTSREVGQVQQR